MGRSNTDKVPTESSRLMRGAWEALHEYIFELRTETKVYYCRNTRGVGCDGACTRYRARAYFCGMPAEAVCGCVVEEAERRKLFL